MAVSGSGNVAQYAVEKVNQLGGKVVTLSDSNGTIVDKDGIKAEKWEFLMELKNVKRGRIKEYADKFHCEYFEGKRPWGVKCDVALPCATQNEVSGDDAKTLVNNGCICVSEGANMPTTLEGVEVFLKQEDPLRPRQGGQRRRRGRLRPGDDAEQPAPVLDARGGRQAAARRS